MSNKITERDILRMIAEEMNENDVVVDWCEKKLAALDKKSEKARERAAAKRAEGDKLMDTVQNILTSEWQSLNDIVAQVDSDEVISNSKITYRLGQLVKNGIAEKTDAVFKNDANKSVKRKVYKLA